MYLWHSVIHAYYHLWDGSWASLPIYDLCSHQFRTSSCLSAKLRKDGSWLFKVGRTTVEVVVYRDLGESTLEGGYTCEIASPEKQRGTHAMFTLTCNPALSVL